MLKLRTEPERIQVEWECETCGCVIVVPWSYVEKMGEPEVIECSTCAAIRKEDYRQRKLLEHHTPKRLDDLGHPIQIPPMIDIDTRDLPGFVQDRTAKRLATQFALFFEPKPKK